MDVVRLHVFLRVGIGPFVDVDAGDFPGSGLRSHKGKNTCPASHVQHVLTGEEGFQVEDGFQHEGRGGVVAGSETHLGVDDNLVLDARDGGVESGPDQNPVLYDDRGEILFPYFIPVLVFDFRLFPGNREGVLEEGEKFEAGYRFFVVLVGGNVGLEAVLRVGETVVTDLTERGHEGIGDIFHVGSDVKSKFRVKHAI